MKIFVKVLSIFFLCTTMTLFAQSSVASQTRPSRELGKEDFRLAKMLYKRMLASENWKRTDSISKFMATQYRGLTPPSLSDDSLYIRWISTNLHLTKFQSLQEVLCLRDRWLLFSKEVQKDNLPLFELMSKASGEQIAVIIQPFVDGSKEYYIGSE